jgi:hypothetical protein
MCLPFDSATPLLGTYSKEMTGDIYKGCGDVVIAFYAIGDN